MIPYICIAILAFLVFALGLMVSLGRTSANVIGAVPEDPANTLYKRVRAHGNTCEYAPMLAVLMLYLGHNGASGWVVWAMIIATVSRVSIVIGLLGASTLEKANPFRFLGALGTYLAGLALVVATVMTVL